ncbi:MAG TPA: ABC transporter ATP-binding protein [Candidatus Micrarchaeaceae archaeon]|nr:ABC transporter ATP-binding protein [Candidatus Micrarchaeaceae archaeon]
MADDRAAKHELAPADPIFAVRDLVKGFGGLRAVDGATFEVSRGSITALIGPNGAGKTTLFNLATGFIKPDRGAIEFEGQSVFGRPPHAVARRGMGRTFQITKALAAMTVLDNMMLAAPDQPAERLLGLLTHPLSWRRQERSIRERSMELLERFRLASLANSYAGTLSGGQRKLLEFARLLMAKPRMVLLDEPLAGVNPVLGQQILAHVHELRSEEGITFLFIEHDMEVVMNNADRVIVMAFGRVIASGLPSEVRRDQRVIDAYLGAHAEDVA